MHKLNLIALIIAASIGFSGCNQYDLVFEIESFADMVIPAGTNTTTIYGLNATSIFPYQAQLSNINLSDDSISEVVPNYAIFRSRFNEENLDFIHVVEVLVVNQDNPDDTQEIFYFDPIPIGRKTRIELFPSLPDLKRFIKNDRLQIKIECTFRSIPPKNFDMRLDMVFGAIEVE